MQHWAPLATLLLWLVGLLAPTPAAAQPPSVNLHLDRPAERGCRLRKADLQPIIPRSNPFFSQHTFDPESKKETAQLDPHRRLQVEQDACLRHHVRLVYTLEPPVAARLGLPGLAQEVLDLLNRLNHGDLTYAARKPDLERALLDALAKVGLNMSFNFPLVDRTYVGQVWKEGDRAFVKLEIVRFVHREVIRSGGVKKYEDDGYFQPGMER